MATQSTQWQVAGSAPENYERYLVPAIFGPWAVDLLTLAAPQPSERVLDLACGTGVIARLAAERVGTAGAVVGLDLNPGMIELARSLPTPTGAAIEWQVGSALELPFANATFDLLLCQQGLQFFPDRPAALRETRRVLRSGGRLALSVWRSIEHSPGFTALAQALMQNVGAEAAGIMRSPFSLGNTGEPGTLLAEAGFRDVTAQTAAKVLHFPSVAAFVQQYVAGSPLAGPLGQISEETRVALIRDVALALEPNLQANGLRFPIEAQLVQAYV
jgi:ubiquinone/menaquinone biosynthesis C-methylase UbiE